MTRSVLRELLPMFARFGLPDVLVTDNGPQLASAEFAVFVKQKGITHVTSSPHYAQSNDKSENAVKTLKLLFAKAKQSGESEYLIDHTRLEKYAIRRYEHESCSTTHVWTV